MAKPKPTKEPVICEICGKEFKDRSGLWGHKRFKHGLKAEPAEKDPLKELLEHPVEAKEQEEIALSEQIKVLEERLNALDKQVNNEINKWANQAYNAGFNAEVAINSVRELGDDLREQLKTLSNDLRQQSKDLRSQEAILYFLFLVCEGLDSKIGLSEEIRRTSKIGFEGESPYKEAWLEFSPAWRKWWKKSALFRLVEEKIGAINISYR